MASSANSDMLGAVGIHAPGQSGRVAARVLPRAATDSCPRVEAPATALVLGRRRVLDEYPPILAPRTRSLFEQAQRHASQDAHGWVLYRIPKDE
jgi:hypothetical protein